MDQSIVLEHLPEGGEGAEIGVHLGDFSVRLLAYARPARLHLIDPWTYRSDPEYAVAWYGGQANGQAGMDRRYAYVRNRFSDAERSGRVEFHRMTSAEALNGFSDGQLDWTYIDGDHQFEFVRRDLELSLQKVRKGGIIAGDDYGMAGWWRDGVTRAVDAFIAAGAAEPILIDQGQFILRAPGPPTA